MKFGIRGKSSFLVGGSLAVLAMAYPQLAWAQMGPPAPSVPSAENTEGEPLSEEDAEDIVVVGVRQAEQSAINRKRNARTAQDSIVADDIGQFPDKNAAEAISRIAGVALDVGDSGEQGGFTIRGQSADLIRIEVDGMTTLSANGDGGGRAAGIGELSSDLIKSVDVVKGQTADMTPGGVGGTVRIEQRTGLDFREPLYRLNVQGIHQSLSRETTPRITAIAAHKFFDDRVGLVVSGTYEKLATGTDYSRVSEARVGYLPLGDLDNSPEKSFTTPFDAAAAAVTTKAGCAALPTLPTSTTDSRRTCYAQWEDFVPSFIRPGRQIRGENRFSVQARLDWRATDDLVAFISYNPNIRKVSSQDYNWSIARPTGTTIAATGAREGNFTNFVVNENHYVTAFDMVRGTGLGFIADPTVTTQVRDIQRRQEQYYTQGGFDFDRGPWTAKARVQYSLAKFQREDRAFQFYAPLQRAEFRLLPESGLWTVNTPGVDLLNPASYYPVISPTTGRSTAPQLDYIPVADRNSEWNYQFDVDRTFENLGPITRIKAGAQHRTRSNDAYREPGFTLLAAANGQPAVVLSRARSLDQIQACNPALAPAATPCVFGSALRSITPTSTDRLQKLHTLTVAQYQNLINSSLIRLPGANFFGGAPGRENLMETWGTIDAGRFFEELSKVADTSAYNLDCLYECIASDGNVYTRPPYHTDEMTTSAYAMADFELRPFGLLIEGNVGVRYQRIKVDAAPIVDFSNRVATVVTTPFPSYTITNQLIRRESGSVNRTSEDYLPSFNIAAWPIEDKLGLRYSIAKQRARPSLAQLTGAAVVNCGIVDPALRAQIEQILAQNPGAVQDDNPNTDDEDEANSILSNFVNRCTGRIGNPELKGYHAITQNLSLEWYPNRDTQLSAAIYQISVKTGRPENFSIDGYDLGGDQYLVDTYRDGPGGLTQRGFEITGRTAFTFLPGFLRYIGGGFNYSYTESNLENTEIDLFTGKALPPRSQSEYYYNLNLWYDDGRLSGRVAYQRRGDFYDQTNPDGTNRIPASAGLGGETAANYFKIVAPVYKSGIEALDARVSFKLTPKFELFAEGKNLLGTPIEKYTPAEYRDVGGGTPYMFDSLFGGRTYYFGAIVTF